MTGHRTWKVIRKGRFYGDYRIVYEGDEMTAKKKYHRIAWSLRQGIVKLVGPDETIEMMTSGPGLRTRW